MSNYKGLPSLKKKTLGIKTDPGPTVTVCTLIDFHVRLIEKKRTQLALHDTKLLPMDFHDTRTSLHSTHVLDPK